ncbi:collagen alpha-1(I) chain-like isoform X1 [Lutra lutra]|uniref:collagen alpha-1(I) chain-like isoform X1 n=1 Tax=Lutra lutra TaxID=9657 RepID=UPI001FD45DD1|nr:collagen alpha-1(I) chain-like isoform X1 [Lutra lutra]
MAPVSGALGSARGRYRQSPVGGWGGLSGQRDGSLGGVPGATPRTRRGRPGALGTDGCVPCASAYRARAQGTAEEPWRPPKSRRPAGASAGTGKRFRREGDSGSGAVSGACSAEPSGGPCGARVRGWGRARGSVSCGPDRARTLSGRRGIARSPRGAPCDPGVEAEDRAARRWLRAGSAGTRHGCRPSAAGLGQGGRGPCCPPRLGCGTAPRLSGGPGGGGAEALGPAVRVWSRRRRTRADRTDGAPRKHSVGGHTGVPARAARAAASRIAAAASCAGDGPLTGPPASSTDPGKAGPAQASLRVREPQPTARDEASLAPSSRRAPLSARSCALWPPEGPAAVLARGVPAASARARGARAGAEGLGHCRVVVLVPERLGVRSPRHLRKVRSEPPNGETSLLSVVHVDAARFEDAGFVLESVFRAFRILVGTFFNGK